MKKILGIMLIAGSLVACNDSATSTDNAKDSIDSVANAQKDTLDKMENKVDSIVDAKKDVIDSVAGAKKDAIDTLKK